MTLIRIIEALLFSAKAACDIVKLPTAIKGAKDDLASGTPNEFARVRDAEVAAALEQLKVEYIEQGRAFHLIEKAEGWQLATDPALCQMGAAAFPRAEAGTIECAWAGDTGDHRVSPADHPR